MAEVWHGVTVVLEEVVAEIHDTPSNRAYWERLQEMCRDADQTLRMRGVRAEVMRRSIRIDLGEEQKEWVMVVRCEEPEEMIKVVPGALDTKVSEYQRVLRLIAAGLLLKGLIAAVLE